MEQPLTCCAVFLAFFDPLEGNKLEWSACRPDGPDKTILLDSVEMLVLAPGFEKVETTHVLFRHKTLEDVYGCAAFHKLSTGDAKERYSRMRCVGVMGSSAVDIRKLVPFLRWLTTCVNNDPSSFELLEQASRALFAPSGMAVERCIDTFLADNHNIIGVNTFGDDRGNNIHAIVQPIPQRKLIIHHSHFLVIWRAIFCKYRVLLFSKHDAGSLCDLGLDLLCAGGETASQPLLFRTNDYDDESNEKGIFDISNSSWFASTTDMRVVLGMGRTAPCWDILIDFDNGASGVHLKHSKHAVHSLKVHDNQLTDKFSSFIIHMSHTCDSRVRKSICKGNSSMWKLGDEYSTRIAERNVMMSCDADRRRGHLREWWETVMKTIESIRDMENKQPLRKNAIKLLIKQHVADAAHIPWLIVVLESWGVDASVLSSYTIMELKFGLFRSKVFKKSSRGRVVPINS